MIRRDRNAQATSPNTIAAIQSSSMGFLLAVIGIAALWVFLPCSIALILASWFALLTRPWMLKLSRRFRGRVKAAAVVTSIVVIAFLGPFVTALVAVIVSAGQVLDQVKHSQKWQDAASNVLGASPDAGNVDIMQFLREHATTAVGAAGAALNTSASVLLGVGIFIVALFAFSTSGEQIVGWLRIHSPLKPTHFKRIAAAYAETGRSLIVGVGVTALAQGLVATITYAAVGISRALVLGLITTIGALIPGVGTLLVWGPVAAVLALTGHPGKGLAVALSGALIIGSIDNFLKPILSSQANLRMPPVLVFITMLSGIAAFGPAGLLLGPLFVRIAMEGLDIAREERWVGQRTDNTEAPVLVTPPARTAESGSV